jgi:hypothetical protein
VNPVFVDSPTEQTTAITDLILALQSLAAIVMLRRSHVNRPMWTDVWKMFFGLLCIASFLGAIVHGIQMTTSFQTAIWGTIYLALGLMMVMFTIAAVTMTWKHELSRRSVPFCLAIAIAFFVTTQLWSDSFVLFVVYEAISLILALTLYSACFWFRREPGSEFLAAGIVVGFAAAIVDTQASLQVTMIWTFDSHGIFHLVQMLSLLLITIGIQMSHRSQLVQKM